MPVPGLIASAGFMGPPEAALLSTTSLTRIGNMTSAGGLDAAFDGDEDQNSALCARGESTSDRTVGIDWGSGVTKTITEATIISSDDNGWDGAFNSGTYVFKLQGSTDNFSSSVVTLQSKTGQAEGGTSKQTITFDAPTEAAYRYHRVAMNRESPSAGSNMAVAELKFTGY